MDNIYTRRVLIVACVITAVVAFLLGLWIGKDSSKDDASVAEDTITRTPSPLSSSAAAATSLKPVSKVIHFLEQGASPRNVLSRPGDSVTFINDSNEPVWPKSDNCPQLDSRRSLNNGDSYSLVFRTKITCSYYNALTPSNALEAGTIEIR